jgi:hypothetical protein
MVHYLGEDGAMNKKTMDKLLTVSLLIPTCAMCVGLAIFILLW